MRAQEHPDGAKAGERNRVATRRAPAPSSVPGAAEVIGLQNSAGNLAVSRALGGGRQASVIQRSPLQTPVPPPPPPPPGRAPAPASASASRSTTGGTDEFELPREHESIRATVPGGRLPLRNKVLVKRVVTMYYGVNRTDIVDEINARYRAVHGQPLAETEDMAALRSGNRPGYKDSDAYIGASAGGSAPAHWPVAPDGNVKVHKGSLESFNLGRAGQAYTGLVRFGGLDDNGAPTEPKIILFPTQSTGMYLKQGVAEHPKEDPENRPEILEKSRVYKNTYDEYTTHEASGPASSHSKLTSRVEDKKKYQELVGDLEADDMQTAGLTIGFTVIKGGGSSGHKFSFVSRSSNNKIFDLLSHQETAELQGNAMKLMKLKAERSKQFGHLQLKANGEGSITKEWGEKIIASVNAATG
ncbi:hypothetical protein [Streptomyces parvulus]|uniref:Uncharacterized protein n=1 Tax=Streptomyces parvulus TaxID=146923 RepID=A0A369UXK6_9ACTN|nr:hypothetical protein [Streptomyces parvulus]RDD85207.1 hypothetical protein DVZ84_31105 [Streptomyces parvulus]